MLQMKTILTARSGAVFMCLLLSTYVLAQAENALPLISNVKLVADTLHRSMRVMYDLSDADSQELRIDVQLSGDGGRTFLLKPLEIKGDAGFPVRTGKQKQLHITWPRGINAAWLKIRLVADDLFIPSMESLLQQVDTASLRKNLEFIARERDASSDASTNQISAVRALLVQAMKAQQFEVVTQDSMQDGRLLQNIIGQRRGLVNEADVFILAAHYDAVDGSPGADDNASGVAGLLEAARILSKYNFNASIRIIAFDGEEQGLAGSAMYVKARAPHERIRGVLNCDMIGNYSVEPNSQQVPDGFDQLFPEQYALVQQDGFRGNFVLLTAKDDSRFLADSFALYAARYVPKLKTVSLDMSGPAAVARQGSLSDHASFWEENIPAIMIGDTGPARNFHYHSANDVAKHVHYGFLRQVVQSAIATLIGLARIQHSSYVVAGIH
jgi:hypothetical protein